MEEQKNNSETTVRDNIQEEATDALVKFIKSTGHRTKCIMYGRAF